MAGRFASLTDDDLEGIIQDKDAKNTKSVVRVAVKILTDYLSEKDGEFKTLDDLKEVDNDALNSLLRKFYGEVRKADGNMYAYKSMQTIRFGLQKHFLQSRDIDIINCDSFAPANAMFKAVMVKLSKIGLGTTTHKDVIIPEDLQKLYNHEKFSRNSPESLQKRTFFEYLYYYCNRGRENLREVQKEDFELGRDGQGRKFVTLKIKRQTKNHRGDNLADVDHKDGRMYELPGIYIFLNCIVIVPSLKLL